MLFKKWNLSARKNSSTVGWLEQADFLLRKHGKISTLPSLTTSRRLSSDAIWIEGPIDDSQLKNSSINHTDFKVKQFKLRVRKTQNETFRLLTETPIGSTINLVREISNPGKKMPSPETAKFYDPFSSTPEIHVQSLYAPKNWVVLAEATDADSDSWLPVVITNGFQIISGIPLLSLCIQRHWMPALSKSYYGTLHPPISAEIESWIIDLIMGIANLRKIPVLELAKWPEHYTAALTVRHDHDRVTTLNDTLDLLSFYENSGIKASWGFKVNSLPLDQISQIANHGHEIVLHSEAGSRKELIVEKKLIKDSTGLNVRGITSHGGQGSRGHLGQSYFEWSSDAGFCHADILTRDNMYPHPAISVKNESISVLPLFLPALHTSLDKSSKLGDHRLDRLKYIIPRKLSLGHQATIMNHPDINRKELQFLLESLNLSTVWCASHQEITDWYRTVNYGCTLSTTVHGYQLSFDNPLPKNLRISFLGNEYVAPAGSDSLFFPSHQTDSAT